MSTARNFILIVIFLCVGVCIAYIDRSFGSYWIKNNIPYYVIYPFWGFWAISGLFIGKQFFDAYKILYIAISIAILAPVSFLIVDGIKLAEFSFQKDLDYFVEANLFDNIDLEPEKILNEENPLKFDDIYFKHCADKPINQLLELNLKNMLELTTVIDFDKADDILLYKETGKPVMNFAMIKILDLSHQDKSIVTTIHHGLMSCFIQYETEQRKVLRQAYIPFYTYSDDGQLKEPTIFQYYTLGDDNMIIEDLLFEMEMSFFMSN